MVKELRELVGTHTSKGAFPYDSTDCRAAQKLDAMIKFDEVGKAAWPRDSC